MRTTASLAFCLLAGCSGGSSPAPTPARPTMAALPITAPIEAGRHLRARLEQQSELARGRAAALDETIGGGR